MLRDAVESVLTWDVHCERAYVDENAARDSSSIDETDVESGVVQFCHF